MPIKTDAIEFLCIERNVVKIRLPEVNEEERLLLMTLTHTSFSEAVKQFHF